jgi:hypothetical protein
MVIVVVAAMVYRTARDAFYTDDGDQTAIPLVEITDVRHVMTAAGPKTEVRGPSGRPPITFVAHTDRGGAVFADAVDRAWARVKTPDDSGSPTGKRDSRRRGQ